MASKERADQVSGAIFLIGLGVIALINYWWPGIMFVIGAALIARGMVMGQQWQNITGALVVIGIGLIFALEDVIGGVNFWPLALIILGLVLLFGKDIVNRTR
ncbi:MAG: hypothetical protein DWB42_15645 [Chloroflexi bacterium]|jgi:hypothetical protein|nr:hypothetical protein [Chloroflexota bacterium]MDL1884780.1 hypothetical protein [Anaerolineae bacterium CFX8]GIL11423.1 MAG: hypothetical protein BroJett038_01430 [Chloroflexota bacterium]